MRLRPLHRLRIAFVVVFCLLFQQVAVAAYVCDQVLPAPAAPVSAHCQHMPAPPPAPAKDSSPLCEKHCTPDLSTPADHAQLAVPALALAPLEFAPVLAMASRPVAMHAGVPVARSDPPPRLRYCSLLI